MIPLLIDFTYLDGRDCVFIFKELANVDSYSNRVSYVFNRPYGWEERPMPNARINQAIGHCVTGMAVIYFFQSWKLWYVVCEALSDVAINCFGLRKTAQISLMFSLCGSRLNVYTSSKRKEQITSQNYKLLHSLAYDSWMSPERTALCHLTPYKPKKFQSSLAVSGYHSGRNLNDNLTPQVKIGTSSAYMVLNDTERFVLVTFKSHMPKSEVHNLGDLRHTLLCTVDGIHVSQLRTIRCN